MENDTARSQAIDQSFELAAERGGDLTDAVYALLFERHPEARILFRRDSNGAVRGEMLTQVFEAIIDFVGDRRYSAHLIQCEVVTHSGYDVPPDLFATFFGIVGEVVATACGSGWSQVMAKAWSSMLTDLDYYVTHPDQRAA